MKMGMKSLTTEPSGKLSGTHPTITIKQERFVLPVPYGKNVWIMLSPIRNGSECGAVSHRLNEDGSSAKSADNA